jgi:hypothetical protein
VFPGSSAVPVGQISLPVTFGSKNNFWTEFLRFEVADLESAYHAILGRPGITKFLSIPHYAYMVVKMTGPKGVICPKGDMKHSYAVDEGSCTLAESSVGASESKKLQKEVEESKNSQESATLPTKMIWHPTLERESIQKKTVQLDPNDLSKVIYIGSELDPK